MVCGRGATARRPGLLSTSDAYVREERSRVQDRLHALGAGGVVGDHGLPLDADGGERHRDHHAGPVLARGAVHQRGAGRRAMLRSAATTWSGRSSR